VVRLLAVHWLMHVCAWRVLQVGLIAARRTGRLRGTKQMTGKSADKD